MFTAKTVVITGATGALGSALVQALVAARAVIIAVDRDAAGLAAMQDLLSKKGAEFHPIVCDLLDPAQVQEMFRQIDSLGPVDIWINNAGTTSVGSFLDEPQSVWDRVFEVNFSAAVRLTREALGRMQKQGRGCIVNLASVAGSVPAAWMTAYTASKHALVGFTRALQEELRQQNSSVKLILVCPGFFESGLIQTQEASFPEWLRPVLGTPDAVAKEILRAMESGSAEAVPTWNGKLLLRLYRSFPRMVTRSSKVLLTRGPLDLLLNRYHPPRKVG
jgi:uncharacterized protein